MTLNYWDKPQSRWTDDDLKQFEWDSIISIMNQFTDGYTKIDTKTLETIDTTGLLNHLTETMHNLDTKLGWV